MKKKMLLAIIVCLLFTGVGCTTVETEPNNDTSMFIMVEDNTLCSRIVYHRKTKVMYAVSSGTYNAGTFTVLVNPDGTPMLWKGDE